MSLYHFNVKQVSRGKGGCAVASAAYISGEKIQDDYYGKMHDYTKKGGVIHSEIMLPDNAPERFNDRKTLWNEVERIEKHPKAQLCYNFNFSLQNELSYEENYETVKQFIQENFISRGMIVDFAIHNPEKDGIPNPHVHMLIPIRPLKEDGSWGNKQHREYLFDENNNPIMDENGNQKFKAVSNTDWGDPNTLIKWRESYANLFNEVFERKGLDCRITHQSYANQGLDIIPTIHEGPAVRAMEAKGIETEVGKRNRIIKLSNKFLTRLSDNLSNIIEWISEFIKECQKEKIYVPTVGSVLMDYYEKRSNNAYSNTGKIKVIKEWSRTLAFLDSNHITTYEQLSKHVQDAYTKVNDIQKRLSSNSKRTHEIKEIFRYREMYKANKPFFEKSNSFILPLKKEKYKETYSDEIKKYHLAERKLNEFWGNSKPNWSELEKELKQLSKEHTRLSYIFNDYKETANFAYRIKCISNELLNPSNDIRQPGKNRNRNIER